MKCIGCLWACDCDGTTRCGDFTPIDDSAMDVLSYEKTLRDRVDDAKRLAKEYDDGNWKEDEWLERKRN